MSAAVAVAVLVAFIVLLSKSPLVAGSTVFVLLVLLLLKVGKTLLNRPRRPVVVVQQQPDQGDYEESYYYPEQPRKSGLVGGFFRGLWWVISAPFRFIFFFDDLRRDASISHAERNAGKASEAMLEMGRAARRSNMNADRAKRLGPWK